MRSFRLLVLLSLPLVAASGCYVYTPSSPVEVAPGQAVRVRLSAAEALRYQDLRLADPRTLEGTVAEGGSDGLMLEASVGANDATRGTRALTQLVSVPYEGIVAVDLKELDRVRTGLLVGGGGAALLVALLSVQASSDNDAPGGGDTPEARRIPLLRFNLPVGRR